jgi:hypothetical protein
MSVNTPELAASYDSATLKVTELFNKAILLPLFFLRRLHGCVLDFIHLSPTGMAEIAKSTHLKACPHTFVYIVYLNINKLTHKYTFPQIHTQTHTDTHTNRHDST